MRVIVRKTEKVTRLSRVLFYLVLLSIYATAILITFNEGAKSATVISKSGEKAYVSKKAQANFQCLINKLDQHGVLIRHMHGIGDRDFKRSLHPVGYALDVNQTRRNVTNLPRIANKFAKACGLISGAVWRRNPDFGHFQLGGWNGKRNNKGKYHGSMVASYKTIPSLQSYY